MTLPAEQLIRMYRKMVTIRRFEEAVFDAYHRGWIMGIAHLYIGEEAVAVGACAALRSDDNITSTHRGHGHCIAKSGDIRRMMAEVMGKRSGYCRGKGGSMHIADASLGILGANGIVGGGFGIATGAALAIKKHGRDQVVACFFGDGAANQGIFFEVMNLARIWSLPLIFLCENNEYGQFTPYRKVTAGGDIAARSTGFGIPGKAIDGNDVLEVWETVSEAVARARAGAGPTLIECKTYRHLGHHSGDPGKDYRPKDEIQTWMARDPIQRFSQWLIENGQATEDALATIDSEVEAEIAAAVEFAWGSPFPDISEVTQHVYA